MPGFYVSIQARNGAPLGLALAATMERRRKEKCKQQDLRITCWKVEILQSTSLFARLCMLGFLLHIYSSPCPFFHFSIPSGCWLVLIFHVGGFFPFAFRIEIELQSWARTFFFNNICCFWRLLEFDDDTRCASAYVTHGNWSKLGYYSSNMEKNYKLDLVVFPYC